MWQHHPRHSFVPFFVLVRATCHRSLLHMFVTFVYLPSTIYLIFALRIVLWDSFSNLCRIYLHFPSSLVLSPWTHIISVCKFIHKGMHMGLFLQVLYLPIWDISLYLSKPDLKSVDTCYFHLVLKLKLIGRSWI